MNKKQLVSLMILIGLCGGVLYSLNRPSRTDITFRTRQNVVPRLDIGDSTDSTPAIKNAKNRLTILSDDGLKVEHRYFLNYMVDSPRSVIKVEAEQKVAGKESPISVIITYSVGTKSLNELNAELTPILYMGNARFHVDQLNDIAKVVFPNKTWKDSQVQYLNKALADIMVYFYNRDWLIGK